MEEIKFIDLFAGIGGIRKGFELACDERGLKHRCVFTSEIKPHAINVLQQNHPDEHIYGDITKIEASEIPDFDYLLAGFPCQAFSYAGKRMGFQDTRGTLFFEVERIIKEKQPLGFVLENVEGLVYHDRENKTDKMGRTLRTILEHLESMNYKVSWKVLNAKDYGVPQDRKRIYIVGAKNDYPVLDGFSIKTSKLGDILEYDISCEKNPFIDLILKKYPIATLPGKSIKDKRGGNNNIHSWDLEYKGVVTEDEKYLLNLMVSERRKKKWAEEYGIDWMDGMPLTKDQILTFYQRENLDEILQSLTNKGYLKLEHPKRRIDGLRVQDETLPIGYNIVAGKMSFEVSKVLDPNSITPTLVAMDMRHLYVIDSNYLRKLTLREGLRLFGYPDTYKFDVNRDDGYDLLGNTVVVPVIKLVAGAVLDVESK